MTLSQSGQWLYAYKESFCSSVYRWIAVYYTKTLLWSRCSNVFIETAFITHFTDNHSVVYTCSGFHYPHNRRDFYPLSRCTISSVKNHFGNNTDAAILTWLFSNHLGRMHMFYVPSMSEETSRSCYLVYNEGNYRYLGCLFTKKKLNKTNDINKKNNVKVVTQAELITCWCFHTLT